MTITEKANLLALIVPRNIDKDKLITMVDIMTGYQLGPNTLAEVTGYVLGTMTRPDISIERS